MSDQTEQQPTEEQWKQAIEELTQWCEEAKGHSEDEIREAVGDHPLRCVARDGKHYAVTCDYKPERINIAVNNGIVTDAYLG